TPSIEAIYGGQFVTHPPGNESLLSTAVTQIRLHALRFGVEKVPPAFSSPLSRRRQHAYNGQPCRAGIVPSRWRRAAGALRRRAGASWPRRADALRLPPRRRSPRSAKRTGIRCTPMFGGAVTMPKRLAT